MKTKASGKASSTTKATTTKTGGEKVLKALNRQSIPASEGKAEATETKKNGGLIKTRTPAKENQEAGNVGWLTEKWEVKYRPDSLATFHGQSEVKTVLASDFKNKQLSRSILITGPAGCGKTTLARIIANTVNNGLSGRDVQEYNASSNRGIEFIRELIDLVEYLPSDNSKLRFILLDEVHQLTPQAVSAFLKPLEEPPAHVVIILCTNMPEKLPDTIIRRCKHYQLSVMDSESIGLILHDIAEKEKLVPKIFTKLRLDTLIKKVAEKTNTPSKAIQLFQHLVKDLKNIESYKTAAVDKLIDDCEKVLLVESKLEHNDRIAIRFLYELYRSKANALKIALAMTPYLLTRLIETAILINRGYLVSTFLNRKPNSDLVMQFADKMKASIPTKSHVVSVHNKLFSTLSEFNKSQETKRQLGYRETDEEIVDRVVMMITTFSSH